MTCENGIWVPIWSAEKGHARQGLYVLLSRIRELEKLSCGTRLTAHQIEKYKPSKLLAAFMAKLSELATATTRRFSHLESFSDG